MQLSSALLDRFISLPDLSGGLCKQWRRASKQNYKDRSRRLRLKAAASAGGAAQDCGSGVGRFVNKNAMSLLLVGGTALGLAYPVPGQLAHRSGLTKWVTAGMFLLSGCSLQDGDLIKAREAWPCGVLALASILLITPLAALLVLRIDMHPKELVTGLAIFSCAPTTLSTGVALAQLAGGNKALALSLTVLSNFCGIFTMPLLVSTFIARKLGVHIPSGPLLRNMVQLLLIPLIIGKVARESISGFSELVDANRDTLSFASALLLSTVPWMQMSCSRTTLLRIPMRTLLACLGLGIALHLLFLLVNHALFAQLSRSYGKASTRASILVSSQKTLPVSMAVVEQLNNQLGDTGLLLLPCISAHFMQIIIDTLLVNQWLKSDGADAERQRQLQHQHQQQQAS